MKKIALLTFAAFSTAILLGFSFSRPEPTFLSPECVISCVNLETAQMIAMDAAQPGFAQLHEDPLYFKLDNATGTTIHFTAADGKDAQGYFIKAKKKSNKWLFVIQEWWGLNDYIKKEAETFYSELDDVNVLAIDMYDGKVASTRDSAMKYMQGATPERLNTIVQAAIAYAGSDARIFTVGWCFGGGWSLQTTLLAGKQAAGCIMYYGRPETNIDRLKTLNCDVIGFFGNKDRSPNPDMVTAFENNMKEAGKTLLVNKYEAGHGFANPSNQNYVKEATEDAHAKAIAFLKERMK